MSTYDELVERLNARIEKQRSEHGNYFYNGVADPELAMDEVERLREEVV